jgi:uncharacterized protein YndB with AHSA1/START domain
MAVAVTDRIEKKVVLKAPRARVWRALTTPVEFGTWFGVDMSHVRTFEPGARVSAAVTIPEYTHLKFEVTIEQMTPEKVFSFRWHPHPIKPDEDYSSEPTTLVVFELEDADGGTLLTVVESGFDGIPIERRAEAFRGNEGGWTQQMENIARYVHARA